MKKYAIITILFAMLVAVFYVALAYPLEDEPGKFATPIPTRTATLLPLWTATPERDTPPPPKPYPPPEDPYPGITPIVVPTEIGNPTSTPGPTLFPYWQCRDQNINCTELACQLIKNDGQDYHRVCCQRYDIMCREVPTDAPTDYP